MKKLNFRWKRLLTAFVLGVSCLSGLDAFAVSSVTSAFKLTQVVKSTVCVGYFTVLKNGSLLTTTGSTLIVNSADGECRGVTYLTSNPSGLQIFQIAINLGDAAEEPFTAFVWDAGDCKMYKITTTIDVTGRETIGTLLQPVTLVLNTTGTQSDQEDPSDDEESAKDDDDEDEEDDEEAEADDDEDDDDYEDDDEDDDCDDCEEEPSEDTISFEDFEQEVDGGDTLYLIVSGGSEDVSVSVQVLVSYLTATASNLNLAKATVLGGDDETVEAKKLSFPLTLTWKKGDMASKTIAIPVKALKSGVVTKYLSFQLANAKGMPLGDCPFTRVSILGEDTENVYVQGVSLDTTLGTVSGSAVSKYRVKSDSYKPVTLKAKVASGCWFVGWADEEGEIVSRDANFAVTPSGYEGIKTYFAQFVKADGNLAGTYSGFARVNLYGMNIIKKADTESDVLGDYPATFTLSEAGKLTGSITIGTKKATLAGSGVVAYDASAGAVFRVKATEKPWFGAVNNETFLLYVTPSGLAYWGDMELDEDPFEDLDVDNVDDEDSLESEYAPVFGDEPLACFYKDISKSSRETSKLSVFAGQYVGGVATDDEGIITLSMSVDKTGGVNLAGYFRNGKTFATKAQLGGYVKDDDGQRASCDVCFTPTGLGSSICHLGMTFVREDDSSAVMGELTCSLTLYTAARTEQIDAFDEAGVFTLFTTGCWIPDGADLEETMLELVCDEDDESITIPLKAVNGKIVGLGAAQESGYTVKFDATTGLMTVAYGKQFTIIGYLGADGEMAFARVNSDGMFSAVAAEFEGAFEEDDDEEEGDDKDEDDDEEEDVDEDDDEEEEEDSSDDDDLPDELDLRLGWDADEGSTDWVVGEDWAEVLELTNEDGDILKLTVSGLPSGLTYDNENAEIVGTPKKAGSYTVTVSFTYAGKKYTRRYLFVVNPADED